jgi:predicted nucleic acid-binding protein
MSDKAFADSNVLIYAIESEGANVSKATAALPQHPSCGKNHQP